MNAPEVEQGQHFRGRQKRPCHGCLCSPTQVGGISSQMLPAFLSHPAACLVVPLGAASLHAQVTIARRHERLIPACLEPVEERNVVAFAVQGGSNKWSEMGRGGAPHQPLLLCCPPPTACPSTHLLFGITCEVQKVPQCGQISL